MQKKRKTKGVDIEKQKEEGKKQVFFEETTKELIDLMMIIQKILTLRL
jgi:hypothetical protein